MLYNPEINLKLGLISWVLSLIVMPESNVPFTSSSNLMFLILKIKKWFLECVYFIIRYLAPIVIITIMIANLLK